MRGNKNYRPVFRSSGEGYTIVESMIFLAITGAILVSAMLLIGGQQRKSEFNTGIRDIQSQISDILNDVSTGFYNSPTGIVCDTTAPGSPATSTGGSVELGGNADCIFVGKVIQFASSDNGEESAEVYSLIGRRQKEDKTDVRTLADAAPKVLDEADTVLRLPYGIKVRNLKYTDGGTTYDVVGSIGLTSRFAGNAGSGGIEGTQVIDLIAINGTELLTQSKSSAKTSIQQNIADTTYGGYNPDAGIIICFESGGTNQVGEITIGGAGREAGATLTIRDGVCT